MRHKILIYCDYGCADIRSLQSGLSAFFMPEGISVELTDAAGIVNGDLKDDVLALFIGGGAGTPYHLKLSGKGNEAIRGYVEKGGVYFGICAGAYYACRDIVFEEDIPELCIKQQCGLNLYDGTATGTLKSELGLYPYELTAFALSPVRMKWKSDGALYMANYHGGPWFSGDEKATRLADYDFDAPLAAIVMKDYGNGRVILSGVHFEDSADILKKSIHPHRSDFEKAVANAEIMAENEEMRVKLFNRLMSFIFI